MRSIVTRDLQHLHHGEKGATLLEALISMVVVAFGLLGVLALQLYTIKGSQSSHLTSQLTLHAYELFDLMRADRKGALDGAFDDGAGGARKDWQDRLTAVLGDEAKATLKRSDELFELTISWPDARGMVVDGDGNSSGEASGGKLVLSTEI
ncbi:type IV pilus modification protein PilV [Marinobacterium marinum]|uniref:Type IV pilus modification protein PilV n=1 Tax=Marinobacterium marinum TaxID=2756129 RepID=A0A7W2ABA6_9GAMM|nr:type IV pilus modification protein PilV [Marinobacterium marinum]MBA4501297.1 type IV pilus modification protein PilV [Marinobacterium marinum]